MAGLELQLVAPTRKSPEQAIPCSNSALCERVRSTAAGCDHCQRFIEQLIVETRQGEQPSNQRCDANLVGFCVPLKHGGEILGYLLAGGYHTENLNPMARNRMRHLLTRMDVPDIESALTEFEQDTLHLPASKHEALQRWVRLAADASIRSLELTQDATERPLPTFVTKICTVIQSRYVDPPSLTEAANICGLSEGYFCRAFHQFTGLRFVEYIHAVRVEHVCEFLESTNKSITDIAFLVGFESLSQFNRVFRKLKGKSPRQWRSEVSMLARA